MVSFREISVLHSYLSRNENVSINRNNKANYNKEKVKQYQYNVKILFKNCDIIGDFCRYLM